MSSDRELEQQCSELVLTLWKQPIPPVRVPRRARDGRLLLDFVSESSRQQFKASCIHKVSSNCLDGARSACSLRAIDHCRGPAWLRRLGWKTKKSWEEVEACEQQYMEACMSTSTKACQDHAGSFCELVVAKPNDLVDEQ